MLYEASGRRVKNFLTYLPCSSFSPPSFILYYHTISHRVNLAPSELNPLKEILNLLAIGSTNFRKKGKNSLETETSSSKEKR